MQQSKVDIPRLLLMTLIYVALSLLGFFTQIEAVLFPVFALPFALYVARCKPSVSFQAVFHGTMLGINYLTAENGITAIFIYGVSVVVIAYVILFFYKQQLALPNFIAYVAVSLCVIIFIFFTVMKMKGIDFEQIYIKSLDSMNTLMDEMTKAVAGMQGNSSIVTGEYVSTLQERQKYMSKAIEQMKQYYAYTVVTLIISVSALTVIIYNAILRAKDKTLPSIKELIEFRLSKAAVFIFVIIIGLLSIADTDKNTIFVLGLNLINVFVWLFKIAGGLGLIGLVNRSAINGTLKVFGYIGIALAFGCYPLMNFIAIYGCLDAFFNFRKVEIVV